MPVTLSCLVCAKQFQVPPSQVKAGRRYCSRECQAVAQLGAGNANWKGPVIGVCLMCGKETRVKPSHAARGEGKFCSYACAAKWKSVKAVGYDPKTRIKRQCAVCGKDIFVKPSHVATEGVYCSRVCMAEGYRRALRGLANPNYRHGRADTTEWRREWAKKWRAANKAKVRIWNAQTKAKRRRATGKYTEKDVAYLMRQQAGVCVLCGCSLDSGYHVDHRVPLARGGHNGVGNLQLLCPPCNMKKRTFFMVEIRYREGR